MSKVETKTPPGTGNMSYSQIASGTFSIAIGGLAATKAEENEILEEMRRVTKKFSKAIHAAQWDGATTGRQFLKE